MAVDVVVINYKTPDLVTDFIDSYFETSWHGCTLTVVEVQANPTAPMHRGTYPEAKVDLQINLPNNLGYGSACNTGARVGSNDVILLANADTRLTNGRFHPSGDLRRCYEALLSRDDWGVLGPRQINEHGQITAGGIFGHDRAPSQRGWNETDQGQYSDVRDDALTVSGALYFIKRSVWEELTSCELFQQYQSGSVGAFLETPHYFDETFCSYHARAHGHKCVYYGPTQMVHLWHKSSEHGGWADQQFARSQQMHREACALHEITCE